MLEIFDSGFGEYRIETLSAQVKEERREVADSQSYGDLNLSTQV